MNLPHSKNLRIGRFSESGRVYFITKCIDRETKIDLTHPSIATIVCDSILHQKRSGIWHLLTFVIMPDHLHLLVALGEKSDLSKSMANFSKFPARKIQQMFPSNSGLLWQSGFYDRQVRRSVEKCPELTTYIHLNPVGKVLFRIRLNGCGLRRIRGMKVKLKLNGFGESLIAIWRSLLHSLFRTSRF